MSRSSTITELSNAASGLFFGLIVALLHCAIVVTLFGDNIRYVLGMGTD